MADFLLKIQEKLTERHQNVAMHALVHGRMGQHGEETEVVKIRIKISTS